MLRKVLFCLILIFGAAGCGQVNVSIDPKEDLLPSISGPLKVSSFEVTTGSTLRKTTSSGYTVTTSVGDPHNQAYQQTSGGYKIYAGVTGGVMYNQ